MIDFDELIHNYLKREEKPKKVGRYYPSEIGGCLRKVWFSYKYPKKTEADLLKIFEIGNIVHNFVVDVLKSEKNPSVELLSAEEPFIIKMKDFVISGRIDDIILIKANNKKLLIEVKSISDINSIKDAKAQHKMQLQLYMFATKIRNGTILYIDKKNLRSKIFTVPYNESEALYVLERFSLLHKHLVEDTPPKPEGKLDPDKSWMCQYCEYREECDKIDSVKVNGRNKEN
ncbi:MAG: PD-(D/E)XK nuclease family protein [Nanoarchaeota archaeon]|nr:PD-(D/E)XK nuclease family protein [Nanoarchaeota archaeon]